MMEEEISPLPFPNISPSYENNHRKRLTKASKQLINYYYEWKYNGNGFKFNKELKYILRALHWLLLLKQINQDQADAIYKHLKGGNK